MSNRCIYRMFTICNIWTVIALMWALATVGSPEKNWGVGGLEDRHAYEHNANDVVYYREYQRRVSWNEGGRVAERRDALVPLSLCPTGVVCVLWFSCWWCKMDNWQEPFILEAKLPFFVQLYTSANFWKISASAGNGWERFGWWRVCSVLHAGETVSVQFIPANEVRNMTVFL